MELSQKALLIAQSQLGLAEIPKGSNWGSDVKKYLMAVGINFPASWCCAFVYWCYNEAAIKLQVANPVYKTGSVLTLYKKQRAAHAVNVPMPGDVFIMSFGNGLGHTGIVLKVEGDMVHTIEGNTNDAGEREGYEVAIRHRKISSIKTFLRY